MRILVISTWYPFPPYNGSRIRAYYLLKELAVAHEVTLVAFRPESGPRAALDSWTSMKELGAIEQIAVEDDPFRHVDAPGPIKYISPIPLAFVRSGAMARQIRQLANRGSWQAVVVLQMPAARYALQVPGAARVFDYDSPLAAQLQQRYLDSTGARRPLRWASWQKALRYESRVARQFQACTVVSEQDRAFASNLLGVSAAKVQVCPNGVDCTWNQPSAKEPAPNSLIYNGSITYGANLDAVRYFQEEILPLVRRHVPQVTFKVTGSYEGVVSNDLLPGESTIFTGYVEDIRPEVSGAAVCVVPIRVGGGTRLKILEAMALGTPVISTSKGAEGLAVEDGAHLLLADTAEEFAAKTVMLLQDRRLRSRLAVNGRRLVEERYDWSVIGRGFRALVENMAQQTQSANDASQI